MTNTRKADASDELNELRARVEALEAQQRLGWRPLNTETVYGSEPAVDTVRIHTCSVEPAVKDSLTAQPGGLVERVAKICARQWDGNLEMWEGVAEAAIREVAAWLDGQLEIGAAHLLREEAGND